MPFYRIYVDYALSESACTRILENGIPTELLADPVRVINVFRSPEQTLFEIQAASEDIATLWHAAIKNAIGRVVLFDYTPPTPDPAPTPLDVWAKVGTWTKSAGVSTTVIGSLPDAPKGLILWGSGLAGASMGTWNESWGSVIGFSDGTNHRCIGATENDNVSTTEAARQINNKIFHLVDPTTSTGLPTTNEQATVTFNATDATLTWDVTTSATTGFYFVFGGDDIENVAVRDFQAGTTIGNTIVEYTGVGFQGDFAMFLASFNFLSAVTTMTSSSSLVQSVGAKAGTDPLKCWFAAVRSFDNLGSASNGRLQRTGKLLGTMSTSANEVQQYAEWDSWTDDGFKLKWPDPPSATNFITSALIVKGGKWETGNTIQPASTSSVTTLLSDITAEIQGIMAVSLSNIVLTTMFGGTIPRLCIGAQDAAGNMGSLACANSTSIPTRMATIMNNDKVVRLLAAASATASSTVVSAELTDFSDLATEGQFTADYTVTDGSLLRETLWFSLSK